MDSIERDEEGTDRRLQQQSHYGVILGTGRDRIKSFRLLFVVDFCCCYTTNIIYKKFTSSTKQ